MLLVKEINYGYVNTFSATAHLVSDQSCEALAGGEGDGGDGGGSGKGWGGPAGEQVDPDQRGHRHPGQPGQHNFTIQNLFPEFSYYLYCYCVFHLMIKK